MKSLYGLKVRSSNKLRVRYRLLLWLFVADWYTCSVRKLITSLAVDGLLSICDDLGVGSKDRNTIKKRGLCEENFITKLLPTLGKSFDRALGDGCFVPPSGFKVRDGFTVFLGQFIRVALDTGSSTTSRIEAARIVRQVCYYAYKVDFPYDSSQNDAVIASFLGTELEVKNSNVELSVAGQKRDRAGVISDLAGNLLCAVFDRYDHNSVFPKHGPGATSNVQVHQKWSARLSPGSSVGRLTKLYFFNPAHAMDRINRFPIWGTKDYFAPKKGEIAKVVLVPKDSRGPRLISAEPVERQFIQQGVAGQLVDLLQSHPFSRGHVNFDDQSVNQDLAVAASSTRYWATLDLKDASDRVSLGLVHLLYGRTSVYSDLIASRSRYSLLPDGNVVLLNKYAPMGSALCFPVLASVVWALSVASLASVTGDLRNSLASVYVYGDDLIVPSEHAHSVMSDLEAFGLRVNRDKSFVNSDFAESCGRDAFLGHDVTPVRLRNLWNLFHGSRHQQASACVSLAAHAAELNKSGLNKASEYYYSLVEAFLGPLPYATATSPYVGRIVPPSVWESHIKEWLDRERNGWRSFVAYVVRPEKIRNPDDGPWEHIYRTSRMLGTGRTPSLGKYDVPRKIELVRRTFKANAFACGVFPVPEWVKTLD